MRTASIRSDLAAALNGVGRLYVCDPGDPAPPCVVLGDPSWRPVSGRREVTWPIHIVESDGAAQAPLVARLDDMTDRVWALLDAARRTTLRTLELVDVSPSVWQIGEQLHPARTVTVVIHAPAPTLTDLEV